MIIVFTGHRDRKIHPICLDCIPRHNHQWIHGGAYWGFDLQVHLYCIKHDINEVIYRPDYRKYIDRPKYAPIARNHEMVDVADLVIALWDGRVTGGTFDTVNYAIEKKKPVFNLDNFSNVVTLNAELLEFLKRHNLLDK